MNRKVDVLRVGTQSLSKRAEITQAIIDAGLPLERVLFEGAYESLYHPNPCLAALEKALGTLHKKSLATDTMRMDGGRFLGKPNMNGTFNYSEPMQSACLDPLKNRRVIRHQVNTTLINGLTNETEAHVEFRLKSPSVLDSSHVFSDVPLGVRIEGLLDEIEILDVSHGITSDKDLSVMFRGVDRRGVQRLAEIALSS